MPVLTVGFRGPRGVGVPNGEPGQVVGFGPGGAPVAMTLPDGTIPPGQEGQVVGYGANGEPVAISVPQVTPYDDTAITEQIDQIQQQLAALPEPVPPYDDAGLLTQMAELLARIEALEQGSPIPTPAPQMLTAPSIDPSTVTVGDNVTLTLGTYSNATSVSGVLMQGGIDRTAQITDGVWSPGAAGAFTWTVTAEGPGGTFAAPVANGTAEAAVIPPSLDIQSLSYAYIDADTPHTLSGAEVTAIQTEGSGGVVLSVAGTGSPNLIAKVADGFQFGNGRFLSVAGLSADTADGFILLVDVTFDTATGTGQALNFGGTVLRRASATLQVSTPQWTSPVAQNVGTVTPPQRVVMAVEVNRTGSIVRYRNPGTNAIDQLATTITSLAPTTLAIGQGMSGIIHKAVVIRRAEGQPFPITLEDALANFNAGVVTPPSEAVTVHYDEGQSLPLGPNSGPALSPDGVMWRNVFGASPDVLMLGGLRRLDQAAVTQVAAPLLQRYDLTVPTTGGTPALIGGNVPGGMITARALLRDGVETGTMAFQFHGAGGQQVSNFLPGTSIYENSEHWLTQAVATWGEAA